MNFDYKENGGEKAFLGNPMDQYHVFQCGEHDCCANNKKNGDYYVHPCLSYFTNKLSLDGKWWKKAFPAKPKHQYCVS